MRLSDVIRERAENQRARRGARIAAAPDRVLVREGSVAFDCPGCGREHTVPRSSWNGSRAFPTLTMPVMGDGSRPGAGVWWPRCKAVVEKGRIRFLGESTHGRAGETVDLEEIEA